MATKRSYVLQLDQCTNGKDDLYRQAKLSLANPPRTTNSDERRVLLLSESLSPIYSSLLQLDRPHGAMLCLPSFLVYLGLRI